ncbi:MAG TPA: succinic semialdehyde dehydrogenase, partial [Desulfuromonadaceae bacterium]
AVVLKPDHQTSFTALMGIRLLYEAGLPQGLVQVVTGDGRILGEPLLAAVDAVSFTGSTATGRRIAEQAGRRLIKCSLELGGKNPLLVLNDADLDNAVDAALRGCFANAGQLCMSFERLYIQSGIHDRFLNLFVERTRSLKLGWSLDYRFDIGSLTSERQLATVTEHVADAVAGGATLLAGGRSRPDLGPFFFEPTILAGVKPQMRAAREETFGPVVAVYRFDTPEEGVALANDSPYGLNAAIFTRNTRLGRSLAARIRCGTVNINEGYAAAWGSVAAPMGGMKDSGMGRRHGAEGVLKFTETQTVAVQRLLPVAPPAGMSRPVYARLMTTALTLLRRLPGLR